MDRFKMIERCPYCGGRDFAEAQARYISPIGDGFHGSVLYHTLCLTCGSVVRSYVKNLKPFMRKSSSISFIAF